MPGDELVQSLLRAMDLLDLVARSSSGLTVAAIAEQTGLKRPTASNLARTLASRGLLEGRGSPTRYVLGPKLAELLDLNARRTIVSAAEKRLAELSRRHPHVGFTFSEMAGGEVHIRRRYEVDGSLQRIDREIVHPYAKATALVLHAFGPTTHALDFQQRYPLKEFATSLWADQAAFYRFIARCRELGYVPQPEEPRPMWSVAAPVYGRGNVLVGAVGAFAELGVSQSVQEQVIADVCQVAAGLTEEAANRHNEDPPIAGDPPGQQDQTQ